MTHGSCRGRTTDELQLKPTINIPLSALQKLLLPIRKLAALSCLILSIPAAILERSDDGQNSFKNEEKAFVSIAHWGAKRQPTKISKNT